MKDATHSPSRPRNLYTSYVIGLCALGMSDLYVVIVPLFALAIGCSATEVGILTGARAFLPTIMAIHGGSLMDRMGTRRVLLWCSGLTAVLVAVIPALPYFWPLLFLQLFSGLFMTYTWIGAQALVAHLCHGDAVILGRFNFVVRIGTICAPVLVGLLWDFGGAWPTFGMVALWSVIMGILTWFVPEPNASVTETKSPSLREVLPTLSDYTRTFALFAIPVIAFTIIIGALRNGSTGLQVSIYVVYLESIGLQGTGIGILFAVLEASMALASLSVGSVRRLGSSNLVIIGTAITAIVSIAVTPFLGGVLGLLIIAAVIRGGAQGFMLPILASVQSKTAGKDYQGAIVGLRLSVNRVTTVVLPPIVGAMADLWGMEAGFVAGGGILIAGVLAMSLYVARKPEFHIKDDDAPAAR
jgi:MFS family permease